MRSSSVVISLSLAAALTGCSEAVVQPAPIEGSDYYTDLPPQQSTVSGFVYDPEAFFFTVGTWPMPEVPPGEEPKPEDMPPPPALMTGIPYLMRSTPLEAQVSVIQGTSDVSSGPVAPGGAWELGGLVTGEGVYQVKVTPPAGGVELWNMPEAFPPEVFPPVPPARYYPTTTLRPIVPRVGACPLQAATLVGEAGALGAVANLLTSQGRQTTPADLVDPNKTGGVVLVWAYSPSPELDIFDIPSEGIAAESSGGGTLYAINWAPDGPQTPPGMSPMGFFARPGKEVSSIGYYALVLNKGAKGPVTVRFRDTVTSEADARPWSIPELTFEARPGVSFARLHAVPGGAPPEDPNEEPVPAPNMSWQCLP